MEVCAEEIDLILPFFAHGTYRSCTNLPGQKRVEWTQTKGSKNEIRWPLEIKISREKTYIYQVIARHAYELRQQGFSWVKVARNLGVSDKTAKKAFVRYMARALRQ